jgi:dTDP-4-amino-4,6-dideoxygalactose transaminase
MTRLYLSPPHMDGDERERLLAAFDSNWITPLGPEVDGFEAELAARSGRSHGAALSSGTAALHLALILTGVGADDEVVVPTLTFAATANAVTYVGAAPVFIDSEFATWNLDPDLLGEFLAARATQGRLPAAVISVDLYGQCADYDRIVPVCEQYGVPLIVDAAEALGATWGGQPAGSFGVFGTFSFNGNKIITSGGGGMLTGDDGDAIARARNLASQAREPAPHYEHTTIGYNYRLSNVLAAIGRGQLADLDRKVARRRAINAMYRDALGGVDGVDFHAVAPARRTQRLADRAADRPRGVRCRPRAGAPAPGIARDRGASCVEADAPPAGVRRGDRRGRIGVGDDLRRGPVPAERFGDDRRRRRARGRRAAQQSGLTSASARHGCGAAGTPHTRAPGATSQSTTAPAPTVAPSPMVTPRVTIAPEPKNTSLPMVTSPFTRTPGLNVT